MGEIQKRDPAWARAVYVKVVMLLRMTRFLIDCPVIDYENLEYFLKDLRRVDEEVLTYNGRLTQDEIEAGNTPWHQEWDQFLTLLYHIFAFPNPFTILQKGKFNLQMSRQAYYLAQIRDLMAETLEIE